MGGAHEGYEIVDQPEVLNKIAAKTKDLAYQSIKPPGTEGREGMAHYFEISLLQPPAPYHPEVRIVKFMGQETQCLFRVKITKIEAIR